MGGHGALIMYLNSIRSGAKQYRSVSAFAPVANPTQCKWGHKAFSNYLKGGIEEAREKYDATELISQTGGETVNILIDYVCLPLCFFSSANKCDLCGLQGTGDNFYKQDLLLPDNFLKAARSAGYDEVQVRVRAQDGYDHSYYFVRDYTVYTVNCISEIPVSCADVDVRSGSHSL